MTSYATRETDSLKRLECASASQAICTTDERGVLRTDGTRTVDYRTNSNEQQNWLTKSGMAAEGSELHLYDPGQKFENSAVQYFVTDTSKVHDWFNSWNYSPDTDQYINRSLSFNSAFQVFSFSGMPIAAMVTMTGYVNTAPGGQRWAAASGVFGFSSF